MFGKLKASGRKANRIALPEPFAQFVPSGDQSQPWESIDEERVVLAGRHALILIGPGGVEDSGLWHEVQYVKWTANNRRLTVIWVQPGREPVVVTTETDDPRSLMEAITTRVEKTIVATRSFYTPTGVKVSASIRRRVDGELFSTLLADGDLSEDDRIKADEIEQTLREELGVED
ncbi:hypothetical protein U6G28_07675 [Actinomycetaceae bacterium MB13-C1-2]|nr:hypothetical protein U6G28_07675 [Actinomycetaceae bacterium MB13-C1-2]